MTYVIEFFLWIWEWLCSWFKPALTVNQAMPQVIEETDIVKFMKRRFPDLDDYEVFNVIQQAMANPKSLLFTNVYPKHVCAGIAVWLAEMVPNIKIALASPNLKHSEGVRELIDEAMAHRKTKTKNKEHVVYENGAEIRTVTHNSYRGMMTDMLILNSPEYMQEYQIGQYVASQMNGRMVGVVLDSVRLKPTYFTAFSKWNCITGYAGNGQVVNEPAPESWSD